MDKDLDLDVANEKVRKKVNNFKKNGLPKEESFQQVLDNLNKEQKNLLRLIMNSADEENKISKDPRSSSPEDPIYQIRQTLRSRLQKAIEHDMCHLGIIQRHLVLYGAIPDPETNWKYYITPDVKYACWICGEKILQKQQRVSIHDGPFPLSGGGNVERKTIKYCPNCESEPSSHTTERKSPGEAIAEEHEFLDN